MLLASFVHATGPQVGVRSLDRGLRLRVEVSDSGAALPVGRAAAAVDEHGAGLLELAHGMAAGTCCSRECRRL